jgi:hypothetical protein
LYAWLTRASANAAIPAIEAQKMTLAIGCGRSLWLPFGRAAEDTHEHANRNQSNQRDVKNENSSPLSTR